MDTIFAGTVLTETIFGLAGVGRMLFEAITARDYPIVQAFTLVIAIGYVGMNLLVDKCHNKQILAPPHPLLFA